MIGGAPQESVRRATRSALDAEIRRLVAAGEPAREIAAALAARAGLPKRQIYARALAVREED